MAILSNYLSGGRAGGRAPRRTSPYARSTPYKPYAPRSSNTGPRQQSAPYSSQDLASALLQQQQQRKITTPSPVFESQYDYDPLLARIQALGAKSVATAQTEAEQLRRKAVTDTGDVGIATELKFDPNTIAAAQGNPESIYASLDREFAQRQKDLIEAMQAQNLYNSGTYVDALSQLTQGKASAQASAGQRLRDLLSGIDTGVLDAKEVARQQELQAQLEAELARKYSEAQAAAAGGVSGAGGLAGGLTTGLSAGLTGRGTGGDVSAGLQWTPGTREKISSYGYSDEDIGGQIGAQLDARGWGPYMGPGGLEAPQVMRNGELFGPDGLTSWTPGMPGPFIWVKVGTDYGTSTEMFQLDPPGYVPEPVKTPEEIAAEQEAARQAQALAAFQAVASPQEVASGVTQQILAAAPSSSLALSLGSDPYRTSIGGITGGSRYGPI